MHHFHRTIAKSFPSIAFAGACAALAPACGSDSTDNPNQPEAGTADGGHSAAGGSGGSPAGSGGSAGARPGGAGGVASGGSAGSSTGGKGTGGSADSGTESGATGGSSAGGAIGAGGYGMGGLAGSSNDDGGTADAGEPDAAPEASPDGSLGPTEVLCSDAGAAQATLFVAGTDYSFGGSSELAAVDLEHRCIRGRTVFDDSDIVARVSDGHAFVLERTSDAVAMIDSSAKVSDTIALNTVDGSTASQNPHDIVYVKPPGGGAKAYVSLYNASQIAVLNLETPGVEKKIDLSSFLDPTDADASSDPDVGFYDATTGRVYFVLQRTDVTTSYAPPYIVHCPPVPSLLVGIDVVTDALVDLNGAAAGVGLPLSLVAPADVAVDVSGRRALLLANGCGSPPDVDGGDYERVLDGVEAVNLDTLATTVLFTPTSEDFFSRLVLLGSDSALLQSFGNLGAVWNKWAPSSPSLGAVIAGVPDQAVVEGPDSLLGVFITGTHARVARYSVSSQTGDTVVSSPWAGTFKYTASVALLK
jgi:hypothetical protein